MYNWSTNIYIYIYIYVVHSICFKTFFVQALKIVVDSWKFTMLLLYILWDDWPIFMISNSNEQLQQELEYTLLKPDCHSWWISKMQSGIEDTSDERYAIKSCFKLGKNDATETYGMIQTEVEILFDHLAWIEHQFLSGIRDSSKVGGLWGMMRGMGGVRKSEHLSWLAKGLGLGLLCWGFKGVQEKIPLEEASTLQIGSVQSHFHQNNAPVYNSILIADYLNKSPALAPCNFCLFPKLRDCRYETIEEMKETMMKIIDTLTQEDFLGAFQKLLERYNKCIAVWGDYFEGN